MNKILDRVFEWVDDYQAFAILLFLFLIIALGVSSLIFWFNSSGAMGCNNWDFSSPGCDETVFDSHGLTGKEYLVGSIILLEIIYFIFIFLKKKKEDQSWFIFAFEWKFYSVIILGLVYVVVIPLIWLFSKIFRPMVFLIGILGVIAIYYLINVIIAKLFSKVEKVKKEKKKKCKQ